MPLHQINSFGLTKYQKYKRQTIAIEINTRIKNAVWFILSSTQKILGYTGTMWKPSWKLDTFGSHHSDWRWYIGEIVLIFPGFQHHSWNFYGEHSAIFLFYTVCGPDTERRGYLSPFKLKFIRSIQEMRRTWNESCKIANRLLDNFYDEATTLQLIWNITIYIYWIFCRNIIFQNNFVTIQ